MKARLPLALSLRAAHGWSPLLDGLNGARAVSQPAYSAQFSGRSAVCEPLPGTLRRRIRFQNMRNVDVILCNADRDLRREKWRLTSETVEQVRQASFQALGNLFYVHQRNIPHTALDSAVVCPVQSATLCRLLLIDLLFLADATDCTAKPDANIERH